MTFGQEPHASIPTRLMSRVGDEGDIVACCALLGLFRFAFDEASWEALSEMFQTLLSLGAMQLSLVEDRQAPGGPDILAFCATIFVTDRFCRQARTTLPPHLGLQVVRRYLAGRLPVLDRDEVAFANARTGVNVMMCYGGRRRDYLSAEYLLALREKMAEAFHLAHHSCRLKEFLCEPVGQGAFRWTLSEGFRLRRDYSAYYRAQNLPMPESWQRPWLVGLTREEASADCGSPASGLFVFTSPLFHFTRCEQTILRYSLAGETDEEIAKELSISHWTVKNHWQAIYKRVAEVDGELSPSADLGLGKEARGPERRQHLLAYLRQHLEELR